MSDESDGYNVYTRPFPNVDDGKWPISTRGGESRIWPPDGRELYDDAYPDQMMVVTIETEPAFAAGNPEAVETPPITELIVVDNWDEVLKGIAPAEGN